VSHEEVLDYEAKAMAARHPWWCEVKGTSSVRRGSMVGGATGGSKPPAGHAVVGV
jgi:hypothetical protein